MGRSINPMLAFSLRDQERAAASPPPPLIVWMSLRPVIPRRVALQQSPPPFRRLHPYSVISSIAVKAQSRSTHQTKEQNRPAECSITSNFQAHSALETNPTFRLILHWNQTSISGSFVDWKMLGFASLASLAESSGRFMRSLDSQQRLALTLPSPPQTQAGCINCHAATTRRLIGLLSFGTLTGGLSTLHLRGSTRAARAIPEDCVRALATASTSYSNSSPGTSRSSKASGSLPAASRRPPNPFSHGCKQHRGVCCEAEEGSV